MGKQPLRGQRWEMDMREGGGHTLRNGVLRWSVRRSCRDIKKGGGGSLGAALVACLSMEHVTTGFNSQHW